MATERHVHSGRITYLDGWRGLSLLLVLVGHFTPDNGLNLATFGVELFFVLSGRLMADILFVERSPLPRFFKRRVSRIFPGMAAFVLIVWATAHGSPYAFKLSAVAFALTFTLNYAMVLHHWVQAIENLWSLCIEEHSYLLLGALALLARRRGFDARWAIGALAALSIVDAFVSALLLHQDYRHVYWRTDAHLSSIFLGGLAYLTLRRWKGPSWVPVALFAAGAVVSLGPDVVRYSLGTACLAGALAMMDQAPKPLLTALSWRPLMSLGLWSYSIYLWQQPFFRLHFDGVLPAWAAAVAAILCGLASFHLIEQPARRFLNAHWKSRLHIPGELQGARPQ